MNEPSATFSVAVIIASIIKVFILSGGYPGNEECVWTTVMVPVEKYQRKAIHQTGFDKLGHNESGKNMSDIGPLLKSTCAFEADFEKYSEFLLKMESMTFCDKKKWEVDHQDICGRAALCPSLFEAYMSNASTTTGRRGVYD